jgi:predicted RNase H-like nuclease (RuvC/YqgF family)
MNPWVTVGLSLLTLILGGTSTAAIFKLVAERKLRKVEVTDRFSDSTLKWVQEFQEEAQRARLEAAEARREVAEVRRELAECRHEAENLARDLRNLRGAIMQPAATIERLRAFVDGGSTNGRY